MFHKEGTATGSHSSSGTKVTAPSAPSSKRSGKRNQGGGGGGGGGSALDVPLRKSDRRKLRSRFAELYAEESNATVDGLLDSIFTDSSVELSARKLRPVDTTAVLGGKSGEARITVYIRSSGNRNVQSDNDDYGNNSNQIMATASSWPYAVPLPVAFEVEHSDTRSISLIPSIATLSVLPNILPDVVVNSYTSKYLCRGANLMRGGMGANNLQRVLETRSSKAENNKRSAENAVVAVRVASNPQPFAVGFLHPDLLSAGNNSSEAPLLGEGSKGSGVNIVSCFGDDWTREMVRELSEIGGGEKKNESVFGGTYDDGCYGNVGFVDAGKDGRYVLGLSRASDENDKGSDDECEESSSAHVEDETCTADIEEAAASMKVDDEQASGEAADKTGDGQMNAESEDVDGAKNDESSSSEEEEEEDPTQVQNKLLLVCFQRAVVSLPPSSLPMPVSTFYANHVLAARPEGTTLDIKQSRWKKFGPFLAEQAALGIVTTKDNQTLTSINKGHISLKDARKQRKKEIEAAGGTDGKSAKSKAAIVTLHIIPSRISSSLGIPDDLVLAENAKAPERKGTGYLTKPEVRECLEHYISREGLDDGSGTADIRLDATLCDLLYGRSKKERAAAGDSGGRGDFPTKASRKDAHELFVKKLDVAYALVEMPGSKIVKLERGVPPKIVVEVTTIRGRKNKNITFCRNLEEYGINPVSFASDVSKRFATSATIDEDPKQNGREAVKKKNYVEVGFQGHLGEELRVLLTGGAEGRSSHGGAKGGSYKVPKNVIDLRLKKGVPARRKG